jgi:hypothetical protein
MHEQLFGSKTRVKLLELFLLSPKSAFYVREITRKVEEQINSVRRELANLSKIGILTSETSDNKLYYRANIESRYYMPLRSLIEAEEYIPKADMPTDSDISAVEAKSRAKNPILSEIAKSGNLEALLLMGSYTRESESGIDILIIGEFSERKLTKAIETLEQAEKKTLSYCVLNSAQWKYRCSINDRFITTVLGTTYEVLLDSKNLIN